MELIDLFYVSDEIGDNTPNFNTTEGFKLYLETIAKVRDINELVEGKSSAFYQILCYNINIQYHAGYNIRKELDKNKLLSNEKHLQMVQILFDSFLDIDVNNDEGYWEEGIKTNFALYIYISYYYKTNEHFDLSDALKLDSYKLDDTFNYPLFELVIKKTTKIPFELKIDLFEYDNHIKLLYWIVKNYSNKINYNKSKKSNELDQKIIELEKKYDDHINIAQYIKDTITELKKNTVIKPPLSNI